MSNDGHCLQELGGGGGGNSPRKPMNKIEYMKGKVPVSASFYWGSHFTSSTNFRFSPTWKWELNSETDRNNSIFVHFEAFPITQPSFRNLSVIAWELQQFQNVTVFSVIINMIENMVCVILDKSYFVASQDGYVASIQMMSRDKLKHQDDNFCRAT